VRNLLTLAEFVSIRMASRSGFFRAAPQITILSLAASQVD